MNENNQIPEEVEDVVGRPSVDKAVAFMEEAARYFGKRPTGGEDAAFWSNVTNQRNCQGIALLLRTQAERIAELERDIETWRQGWEDDGRDVRYFSKAMTTQAQLFTAQATIERYREALEEAKDALGHVEQWWLEDGIQHFDGAPYAIFAAREALSKINKEK